MGVTVSPHLMSVIVPTRNRAQLLQASLESLAEQTLSSRELEVVVVDDGSTDETPDVCREIAKRIRLQYHRLPASGISAAKNLGVFAANGSIILFFDDDDVADQDLCRQHLESHLRHPDPTTAVLGYTAWSPALEVTPMMDYIINRGHFLFSYTNLEHGQRLDFTYFWGGRSSCKRLLLVKRGVFNQRFARIIEDIELGYRLSKFGLEIIFNKHARQYMNRPITYDAFCRRCEVQGASQWFFSQVHADPVVREYSQIDDAAARWPEMQPKLDAKVRRVQELEAAWKRSRTAVARTAIEQDLDELYWWTFTAFKMKGIEEARSGVASPSVPTPIERRRPRSASRRADRMRLRPVASQR